MMGNAAPRFSGPTLPQGKNKVTAFIPVARFVDMLESPGTEFTYNGKTHVYPRVDLVYWAGGNPFHHHQDLNRLMKAWRKPSAIIVHEQFWTATARMADVVLPATTSLERDDIGYANRERFMVAMKRVIEPVAGARDDYDIFADLATRMGAGEIYTEGHRQFLDRAVTVFELGNTCLDDRLELAGIEVAPLALAPTIDVCSLGRISWVRPHLALLQNNFDHHTLLRQRQVHLLHRPRRLQSKKMFIQRGVLHIALDNFEKKDFPAASKKSQ